MWPNLLTLSRIFAIPFIVACFYVQGFWAHLIATVLFIIACITDFFDGYLARLYKVQSKFGQCFDPIADKLIVIVALVMIISCNDNIFILIPSLIIMCREILVSGLREFLGSLNVEMPVTKLAKYKTAFQMFAITGLLLASKDSTYTYESIMDYFEFEPFLRIFFDGFIENISVFLLNIAAILSIITGFQYLRISLKYFKQ